MCRRPSFCDVCNAVGASDASSQPPLFRQVSELYADKLEKPTKEAHRRSNAAGLGFAFSQFVTCERTAGGLSCAGLEAGQEFGTRLWLRLQGRARLRGRAGGQASAAAWPAPAAAPRLLAKPRTAASNDPIFALLWCLAVGIYGLSFWCGVGRVVF